MRTRSLHRSLLRLREQQQLLLQRSSANLLARRKPREHRGVSAILHRLFVASGAPADEAAAAAAATATTSAEATDAAASTAAAAAATISNGTGAKLGCPSSFKVHPVFLRVEASRFGARRSRLTLLLERWVPGSSLISSTTAPESGGSSSSSSVGAKDTMATLAQQERARDELGAVFPKCTRKLAPLQTLALVSAMLRSESEASLLSNVAQQIQKPSVAKVLAAYPDRTLRLIEEIARVPARVQEAEILGFLNTVSKLLSSHIDQYGPAALPILEALVKLGGSRVFRKLPEEELRELARKSAEQARLIASAAPSVGGGARGKGILFDNTIFVPEEADTDRVADLYCTSAKLNLRDSVFLNAMSRHIGRHAESLSVSRIGPLAQVLGTGSGSGRNMPALDFILLHALGRLASSHSDEIDGPTAVAILQAIGRAELFDEECLATISKALEKDAMSLNPGQLSEAMYGFGNLQVRELGCLDALCDGLRLRIDEVGESDLVRFVRGMAKVRHKNEELLAGLAPAIHRMKHSLHNNSLTNLTNSLASFQTKNSSFIRSLLDASSSRADRLGSMSLQHLLLALCRLQSLTREEIVGYLEKICSQLPQPRMRHQITPVQANTSLISLSRLQYRDLPCIAVLTSVLMCRGNSPVWSFAPSPGLYKGERRWQEVGILDQVRITNMWKQEFDNPHCADVLQAVQRLDVVSSLTMQMSVMFCKRLLPELHECRAREILSVARAFSDVRMPGTPAPEIVESLTTAVTAAKKPGQSAATTNASNDSTGANDAVAATNAEEGQDEEEYEDEDEEEDGRPRSAGELSWREKLIEHCFENLRRHEHFLESSWAGLTPLKLLCMELQSGIYGTRRMEEFLRSSVFEFVTRLRNLSAEEVEANRLSKERADEEEDGAEEAKTVEKKADGAAETEATAAPTTTTTTPTTTTTTTTTAAPEPKQSDATQAAVPSTATEQESLVFRRSKVEFESNLAFFHTWIGDFPVDAVILPREAIPKGMDVDDPLSFDFANISRGPRSSASTSAVA